MDSINKLNFNAPIIYLKLLNDNRLVAIDINTAIHYLYSDSFDLCGKFKANIVHKECKQKFVSFSNNGKYLISLNKENRELVLINIEKKKMFAKFHRHQGETSIVAIDPLDRYVFSGGDDGKIFALDIKNGKLAFVLPMHKDRVNDISFSADGNWCISIGYDKKVNVFNISTMKSTYSLNIHSSPVMKTIFIDKYRAVTIDKNLSCIIFNIYNGEVIARLSGLHDDVTSLYSDEKFLFLGTALGYVIVYELQEYKMITKQFIKLTSSITQLEFSENSNTLFVATDNGDIFSYNIYLGEDEFRTCLQHKDYKSIQNLLNKNLFLKYTSVNIRFNNIWEETFKKAKNALEQGNMKRVNELFMAFRNIPSKNKIINQLLEDYKDFEVFRESINNGKLALAYNILNKYPEYKTTKMYKTLESRWERSFLQAQKVLSEPRGLDKANDIFQPYRGITQKTLSIQALIKEHMIYDKFKISLAKQDYKMVFTYIELHPFLKEFTEYKNLLNFAETSYIKAINLIEKEEFNTAIKLLTPLQDFNDFKEEAITILNSLKIKQKFFESVSNNNIQIAYKILDNNLQLNKSKSADLLQKKWNQDIEKANSLVLDGTINQIDNVLKCYFNVSSRYISLSNIYAYYYLIELERAVRSKKNKSIIEKGIKKYILLFGLNDQIINFYTICKRYYKDINLNLKTLPKGLISDWKPFMIVESIFI